MDLLWEALRDAVDLSREPTQSSCVSRVCRSRSRAQPPPWWDRSASYSGSRCIWAGSWAERPWRCWSTRGWACHRCWSLQALQV